MSWRSVRLPILVAACLAATATPAAPQRVDKLPAHPTQLRFPSRTIAIPRADGTVHTLSSGTRVVVIEDATLPLAEVTVALRVGSYLDPLAKPGLAELTAAMIRRGGSLARSADAVDDAIDFLGAEIDSSGGTSRSGASLDATTETLDDALAIFFELLATPGFQADRIEAVQTNLLASLEARNDDPIDVMEREWSYLLYGERDFRSRRMTDAEVRSISRDDFATFHRRYWRPEHAVIAVSGDVETAAMLARLEPLVAGWAEAVGEGDDKPLPWPPKDETGSPPGVFLLDFDTPQAKVSIGHALPRLRDWMHRDAVTLEFANDILGGTAGLVSRINGRLRGREGLVYRALSEALLDPDETGVFRIFLDAAPQNVARSIEVCLEEIERLRIEPVSEQTIALVREELLSRLQLRFDSANAVAGYFAEDLLLGRPHDYWYTYARRLRSVTSADIQRVARRYLKPEEIGVLVVGESGAVRRGSVQDRKVARMLAGATALPMRDPLTLLPLAQPLDAND